MSTNDDFFAEQEEASAVKAKLVSKYFDVWTKVVKPSVLQRRSRVAYIDLFAGPGRYEDGKASVPLMILELAVRTPFLRDKLVTIFNDIDVKNSQSLAGEIAKIEGIETLAHAPAVWNEEVGEKIAELLEGGPLVPTLFFVDPWGYKGLSLRLVNSVLRNWGSDCIFFFNYNRINMGINNDRVQEHMEALFGTERAQGLRNKIANLEPLPRELTIVEELTQALKEMGGQYVIPFTFKFPGKTRTSHYLIFVSKHVLGYNIMKDIMARESSYDEEGVPSFSYTDAIPETPLLFEFARPLSQLGDMLMTEFAGQQLPMIEIFDRHNVGRPFIKRNYKDALLQLERDARILAEPFKRKANTFADTVLVTFPKQD